MSGVFIGLTGVVLLLFLIALGVHLAVALGTVGFVGLWYLTGSPTTSMDVLATGAFSKAVLYSLSCIPPFMLMGEILQASGMAEKLYSSIYKLIGRVPGSMGITTVIANAFFGAACGSSFAAVAVFTKIGYKPMLERGYDKKFTAGTIVASSNLSMLIPPSILMIVYGSITEMSIAQLLMAGIGPGLLAMVVYSVYCFLFAKKYPDLAPRSTEKYTIMEKVKVMGPIGIIILLAFFFIGGIYVGFFTPTEAGAVSAFLAFITCFRMMNRKSILTAFKEAINSTVILFAIMICATLFSRFLTMSQLTNIFTDWIINSNIPNMGIVLLFIVIYLFLGCIMDPTSILFITLPIMYPITVSLGIDPVWFAMCLVVALEVGFMTPPVGLTVYGFKATAGDNITIGESFSGVIPFLFLTILVLVLCLLVPDISTFIPMQMGYK